MEVGIADSLRPGSSQEALVPTRVPAKQFLRANELQKRVPQHFQPDGDNDEKSNSKLHDT
jgi:hypothetical protein